MDTRDARENPIHGDPSSAVLARRTSYPRGHRIDPHWHRRAQFMYAVAGTMAVRTPRKAWIVPPSRALWVPAHTVHEIQTHGVLEMRSLYLASSAAQGMPEQCVVLEVTPLLRELVVRAADLHAGSDAPEYDPLLTRLLVEEIRRLPRCALDLPMPESSKLVALCESLLADLAARRPARAHASELGISSRTLYRRFLRETGITFARWQQQARLLESIRRLAEGATVTSVAVDLGYDSPSAFSTMFRRTLGVSPRTFVIPRAN